MYCFVLEVSIFTQAEVNFRHSTLIADIGGRYFHHEVQFSFAAHSASSWLDGGGGGGPFFQFTIPIHLVPRKKSFFPQNGLSSIYTSHGAAIWLSVVF
jgi:hypothetical protein